jgi:hypothetical protein
MTTFDGNGHLETVVVDAKKLTELTDELVSLREEVAAMRQVNPLWENVVKELAEMYEYWAIGEPVGVGRLMQAYDDWLD